MLHEGERVERGCGRERMWRPNQTREGKESNEKDGKNQSEEEEEEEKEMLMKLEAT
jgi:hypothetical protein